MADPQMPASISTPVYGGVTADANDVVFGWSTMSPAAAGIYDLAQALRSMRSALLTAQTTMQTDFRGPYRRELDGKIETFATLADDAAGKLESLADQYGNAWSLARHQQGKICAARGFAKRESEEGFWGKMGDMFGDEEPNEPSQPGVPSAPSYTRPGGCPHEDGCNVTPTHGSIDG